MGSSGERVLDALEKLNILRSMAAAVSYTEDDIKSLDWREHIRLRPGMYIGKLGDGSSADDGIYILAKGGARQLG